MRRKPKYFAAKEGDKLDLWSERTIDEQELERKRANRGLEQPHIYIEGEPVHVFIFADGTAWDVINGWRKDAKGKRSTHFLDWEQARRCEFCSACCSKVDDKWYCTNCDREQSQ